jgi:hypothetical protein
MTLIAISESTEQEHDHTTDAGRSQEGAKDHESAYDRNGYAPEDAQDDGAENFEGKGHHLFAPLLATSKTRIPNLSSST